MANKQSVGLTFFNHYQKLTEAEKDKFARICNKLLDKNFLLRQKESDKEDYFFTIGHLTLFQNYFLLMDYMVTHYEADQIIALSTEADRNRSVYGCHSGRRTRSARRSRRRSAPDGHAAQGPGRDS